MTKATKPILRETESTVRSKGKRYPIIAGLKSGGMVLVLRLKKHRQEYTLPIEWCFWQAVDAHITAEKRARKAAREQGRARR